MFLGAYHFDGDPGQLVPAYEQLMSTFPADSLDLHVAVVRDAGITVYDSCPSEAVFASFSASDEFAGALRAAGLPAPRVERIGNVVDVRVRAEAQR